jgi:hypothetical protein
MPKRRLTTRFVAKHVPCNFSTVDRLARAGKLDFVWGVAPSGRKQRILQYGDLPTAVEAVRSLVTKNGWKRKPRTVTPVASTDGDVRMSLRALRGYIDLSEDTRAVLTELAAKFSLEELRLLLTL